jgi:hypothetical protein
MILAAKTRCLTMVCLLMVFSAALGQSRPRNQAAPSREKLREILARAHEIRSRWFKTPEADEATRTALDAEARRATLEGRLGFQEIPTGRGDQIRFVRALLNPDGAGLDAVRFRTPPSGAEYSLLWEFVVPGTAYSKNVVSWGIVDADAQRALIMDNYSRRDDMEIPGVGLPGQNYCMTHSLREPLKAGTEYILWFDMNRPEEAVPIFVKARLDPVGPIETPKTPALQKARGAFQTSLDAASRRHDAELKALRQKYFAELEKGHREAAAQKDTPESERIIAELDEIHRGDADAREYRGFRVIRADYGADERWADVTKQVRERLRGNVLRFDAGDLHIQPDPAYGVVKTLIITYSLNGNPGVSITRDGQRVELPPTDMSRNRIPAKL